MSEKKEEQQPVQEDQQTQGQTVEVSENKPATEEKGLIGGAIDGSVGLVTNLFDWKIFWWEFIGTALFAHGICASDGQDWYVTLSLFAAILVAAPFSGGHVNPAVSFGFLIKDGIIPDQNGQTSWKFREFFGRSLAQFLGACTGGFTAFTILGMSAAPSIPSEDWRMLGGYFTGEAFGTAMFVLTILIMTDNRTKLVDEPQKDKNGVVQEKPEEQGQDTLITVATIALALHFSRAFTYKTGGGLNPGIAVGLQIWLAIDTKSWEPLIHSWLFIVGPLFGALVAAYYYSLFHLAATNETGCFAPKPVEAPKNENDVENQASGEVASDNKQE